ncbi:MAG TPA: glutamyl-tRNA reductase [Pseudolysinimonas sp.]
MTASHRTSDFALLDRVSRAVSTTAADLVAADPTIRGAIVLATCNRFEAYLDVDAAPALGHDSSAELVFTTLSRSLGADAHELRSKAELLHGDAAIRHLFAVSSGLESVAVGEDEISGQVQRALTTARAEHTSSSALERAFQRAARVSREVRRATDLGGAGRSMVRLALDLAASRVVDWSSVRVLVVGTGRYAATTIAALRARGAHDIRVFSATGRADAFAARYGVSAHHELRDALAGAELVLTCTARYTVTVSDIPDATRRLVIDLGLPRNVEPTVATLPGVELLDLELLALHAPLSELGAGAENLVATAAAEFAAEADAAPGIVALRGHVLAALDDELARVRERGADPRTEEALRHLAGVLVHAPSLRARRLAAEGRSAEFVAGLEALYGLQVESTDADRADDERADGTSA